MGYSANEVFFVKELDSTIKVFVKRNKAFINIRTSGILDYTKATEKENGDFTLRTLYGYDMDVKMLLKSEGKKNEFSSELNADAIANIKDVKSILKIKKNKISNEELFVFLEGYNKNIRAMINSNDNEK